MGIERSNPLYLRNSTTVDSGTGIDIRLLSATNAGVADNTTFVTAVHTEDGAERTFDPASTINTQLDAFTLQKLGWALRLSEDMTPADDTNCDVFLSTGAPSVVIDLGLGWTGTPTGNSTLSLKVSLWQYNPSTDTGTQIATATAADQTWTVLQNNQFKTTTATFSSLGPVTFAQGEILLLQVGLNLKTLSNPVTGTVTYTAACRVDTTISKLQFAAGASQHLYQTCALSSDLVGVGVLSRGALEAALSRDLVGSGVLSTSQQSAAARTVDLVGDGVLSRGIGVGLSRDLVGDGVLTSNKQSAVTIEADLVGDGVLSRGPLEVAVSRDLVGEGVLDVSKTSSAAKTFDLVGDGTITETHPVQTFRSFDLVGEGTVSGSIDIPFDNIPTGACPEDWSPNDGLKEIAGDVFFHEPPNQGDPVVGATVTLIRDSDGLRITSTLTDEAGHYSFPRDTNDPNTYHVEVNWTDGTTDQQGLSESGCVPL